MRSLVLTLAASWVVGSSLAAQQDRATFAVLPFQNEQSFGLEPEEYAALELGLAQLLASELARSPGGQVADRRRTEEAVGKRTVPPVRLDAAAAQRIGGLVGARYVVLGNFVDAYGRIRVNARLVDASSGQFLKTVSNDDPKLQTRDQLHRAVQAVAQKILAELGLPAPAATPAVSTAAVLAFSRGLSAEEAGDKAAAAKHFQAALDAAPGFGEAREAAARVR
jgi:TolB-like protein